MTNAKKELIEATKGLRAIAANIQYGDDYWDESRRKTFRLKEGSTHNDWLHFLDQLDFEYDSGYGGQELFGTVWLIDGTWMARREYDGSEWWEHRVMPAIPEELK